MYTVKYSEGKHVYCKKNCQNNIIDNLKMASVFISVWLGYFLEKLCVDIYSTFNSLNTLEVSAISD